MFIKFLHLDWNQTLERQLFIVSKVVCYITHHERRLTYTLKSLGLLLDLGTDWLLSLWID